MWHLKNNYWHLARCRSCCLVKNLHRHFRVIKNELPHAARFHKFYHRLYHYSLQLQMQSCHNDMRAMTPCFYMSNGRASLGLSRVICQKYVASVIRYIGRTKGLENGPTDRTKCRLENKDFSDLDEMLETTSKKFENKWDRGRKL